jgi:hypothetical protein
MIEILQMFLNMRSRWEKGFGFETFTRAKEWRRIIDSLFEKNVGFHNIKQANWKSPSGFPSFFLPCLR